MSKCPVCLYNANNEFICNKCGYDLRNDFIERRTIKPVSEKDVQIYRKRVREYEIKQQERKNSLIESIQKDQDKKEKVEQKARNEKITKREETKKQKKKQEKFMFGLSVIAVIFVLFYTFLPSLAWNMIKKKSLNALYNEYVNYETDSIDSISNYFCNIGCTVSGNSDSIRVQSNNSIYSNCDFSIFDYYKKDEEQWSSRSIIFHFQDINSYHSGTSEISQSSTALPYGIKAGDTFDQVYDKLGLNYESIKYAQKLTIEEKKGDVDIEIVKPGNSSYILGTGKIHIYFEDYEFEYWFDAYSSKLSSYKVIISK